MSVKKRKNRAYFLLVFVFIVTLGAVILIVQFETGYMISELTLKQADTANRSFVNYLGELEERALQWSDVIVNDVNIVNSLKNGKYDALKNDLTGLAPGVDYVSIYDPDGAMVFRTDGGLSGIGGISAHTNISVVLQTGFAAGAVSVDPVTGFLSVSSSTPVYDGDALIFIVNCGFDLSKNDYVDTFK
ncbi:MAG: hypothetical protein LBI36_04035 [Oscillospiraceae bacterium]|jgi:hypothetical protein|nr:hypothetical protein [Oscillospiraceae bacterium]